MKKHSLPRTDAIILGIGSIATQVIFLRFVLSSETAGELYAAFAIGGWLAWVGMGAFVGRKIAPKNPSILWLLSSIIKLPAAGIIIIYPAFFTGILGPFQFLPLAFGVLALPGFLYGAIFSTLITKECKTSIIYRYEAIGSVIGGLAITAWAFAGFGDIYLLIILALLELSRIFSRNAVSIAFVVIGLVSGLFLQRLAYKIIMPLRWPGYDRYDLADGPSGLWLKAERKGEYYIAHNGRFIPQDRASSEDAVLWPLLFKPDAAKMLLIGFEGSPAYQYLPERIQPSILVSDDIFLKLIDFDKALYICSDPLSYSTEEKFDIVNVYLPGASSIIDYRMETDYFFKRCKSFLKENSILYVSLPSDENYLGAQLSEYQSSTYSSLKSIYREISIIPGSRAGFVCFLKGSPDFSTDRLIANLSVVGINSPYFNQKYISNILNPLRESNFKVSLDPNAAANLINRPESVLNFLKWQGSKFGKAARIFAIIDKPFIYLAFILIIVFPFLISKIIKTEFRSLFLIFGAGFIGMAFEILILYLFQIFYGALYLHIGLLIAIFMAGMFAGSILAKRISIILLLLGNLPVAFGIWLCQKFFGIEIGLPILGIVLYMASLMAGFFSGGVFSKIVDRQNDDAHFGSLYYGTDLYGALLAAVFTPGLLIVLGVEGIILCIMSFSFIILATLLFRI